MRINFRPPQSMSNGPLVKEFWNRLALMRCAASSTDDQPGNWLSWDGLMQAASTNFLQTPFLIITGESRHRLEIFDSKISFNIWLTYFFLNIEREEGKATHNNIEPLSRGNAQSLASMSACPTSMWHSRPWILSPRTCHPVRRWLTSWL